MTDDVSVTTPLADLIARLEKATGPSYALDEAISQWRYDGSGAPAPRIPGPYTSSLDAALTLVPEGAEWTVWGAGAADVWMPPADIPHLRRHDPIYAATPALALCIASLKARSAT